jgi:hypothetical protein
MPFIRRQIMLILASAAMAESIGCEGSGQPDPQLSGRIGDNCTFFFLTMPWAWRRALPHRRPREPQRPDTALTGKLLRVNSGWITILAGKAEYTIPKQVILVVELASK